MDKSPKCKICNQQTQYAFETKMIYTHKAIFYKCHQCGFLATYNPTWLDKAYTKAINATDTGILARNNYFSAITTALSVLFFGKKASILDMGGGYGILVRQLRDIGLDAYWLDKYAQNLLAINFEYNHQITPTLITSFEVFEHLENPKQELESMLKHSCNILFSTLPLTESIPPYEGENTWWYYSFHHGQHISFYDTRTLAFLAKEHKLNYYHYKSLHFFTDKKISPLLFKLIVLLAPRGLSMILKLFLKSKTLQDSKNIEKNLHIRLNSDV